MNTYKDGGDIMELRGYQLELIKNVRKSLISGSKSVVCVLGCGGG